MSDDCCPLFTRFTMQIQRKIHFSLTLYGKFCKRRTKQKINEWIKLGIIIKNKGINMGLM